MDFSVIIPARDEEEQIGRCLDALARQAWERERFEVIVVDNGSRDATAALARARGARVLVRPGVTVAALRNAGAREARGELLAFLDADCTVDGTWLEKASRYRAEPEVVCFGSPPRAPAQATWVQRAWYQVRRKKVERGEVRWLESMNMFVRRDAFFRCGAFDESLVTCEDYDLSLRLGRVGTVVCDSALVAVHHGEAATLARFFRKELWRGAGNLKGTLRHGVTWNELPSLLVPALHGAVCALVPAVLVAPVGPGLLLPALLLFLGWESLLLLVSCIRFSRATGKVSLQIFILLNVYYLARGLAFLKPA